MLKMEAPGRTILRLTLVLLNVYLNITCVQFVDCRRAKIIPIYKANGPMISNKFADDTYMFCINGKN